LKSEIVHIKLDDLDDKSGKSIDMEFYDKSTNSGAETDDDSD
jgi:hypothetical protein